MEYIDELDRVSGGSPHGPPQKKQPDRVTPESGRELIARFGDKLAQRGVRVPPNARDVGTGTRGTAFEIDAKTVIKFTNDGSEAAAQAALAASKVDFAARVDHVFELGSTGYYAIVQERLQPLPGPLGASIQQAFDQLNLKSILQFSKFDTKTVENGILRAIKTKEYAEEPTDAKRFRKYYDLLKGIGIFHIMEGLQSLGIKFDDYTRDNLMMRGDRVVLIDPGYSKGATGGKIEPIPEIVERAMVEWAWRNRMMKLR